MGKRNLKPLFAVMLGFVLSFVGGDAAATHVFGEVGEGVFSISFEDGSPFSIFDVDAEGRSVVVTSGFSGPAFSVRFTRFDLGGAVDPLFGSAGVLEVDIVEEFGLFGWPVAIALDSQARTVVVVQDRSGAANMFRVSAGGVIDRTFGADGASLVTISDATIEDLVIDRHDSAVVVGSVGAGLFRDALVARVTENGRMDLSFGDDGVVGIDVDGTGGWSETAVVVDLHRDGRIVVAVEKDSEAGSSELAVVQLLGDGRLDRSFGDSGVVYVVESVDPFPRSEVFDVAVDRFGRILVAGVTWNTEVDPIFVRMHPDGSIDGSFRPGNEATRSTSVVARIATGPGDAIHIISAGRVLRLEPNGALVGTYRGAGAVRLRTASDGNVTVLGDSVLARHEADLTRPGVGLWLLDSRANAWDLGEARPLTLPGRTGASGVVDGAASSNSGYWMLDRSGRVSAVGAAPELGDARGVALGAGERWVAITARFTGDGYWLASSSGRVLAYGTAEFYGDVQTLQIDGVIVDIDASPDGRGYLIAGGDGGVFAFGSADYAGSIPQLVGSARRASDWLDAAVVAVSHVQGGAGYVLVAADGAVFAFGQARFVGSIPQVLPAGVELDAPIVDVVPQGGGYALFGRDGGVFAFGDVAFVGSATGASASPFVAAVAIPNPILPRVAPTELGGIAVCRALLADVDVSHRDLAELSALASYVTRSGTYSAWADPILGHIRVDIGVLSNTAARAVHDELGTEGVCVDGALNSDVGIDRSVGFRVIDRTGAWIQPGEIEVLTKQGELDALAERTLGFIRTDSIDLDAEIAVLYGVRRVDCVPVPTELVMQDATVTVNFGDAGHLHCERSFEPMNYLLAIDRRSVPVGEVTFVNGQSGQEVTALIGPATSGPDGESSVPAVEVRLGDAEIPAVGETRVARLDSGRSVFVVRHLDGRITVVDVQPPGTRPRSFESSATWAPETRRFTSIVSTEGVWDEYGHSLDGHPEEALNRYASHVDNDRVTIGQQVDYFVQQSPVHGRIGTHTGRRIVAPVDVAPASDPAPSVPRGDRGYVDLDITPDDDGVWLTRSDGFVEARGSAGQFGNATLQPEQRTVALVGSPSGRGYWLVTGRGAIHAFGDAEPYSGIDHLELAGAVVDAQLDADGSGLYLLSEDGGVFAIGDAVFRGSLPGLGPDVAPEARAHSISIGPGGYLVSVLDGIFVFGTAEFRSGLPVVALGGVDRDVVDVAVRRDGRGYWKLGRDGGVFAIGSRFAGSASGFVLGEAVAMAVPSAEDGYLILDESGAVFAFGEARHIGVQRFEGTGALVIPVDLPHRSIVCVEHDGPELDHTGYGVYLFALDRFGKRLGQLTPRFAVKHRGCELINGGDVASLDLFATGSWKIEILPWAYAELWRPGAGGANGQASKVLLMAGPDPGLFSASSFDGVEILAHSVEEDRRMAVLSESGRGSALGPSPVWEGLTMIEVSAVSPWAISLRRGEGTITTQQVSGPCIPAGFNSTRSSLEALVDETAVVSRQEPGEMLTSAGVGWPGWHGSSTARSGDPVRPVSVFGLVDCPEGGPTWSRTISAGDQHFLVTDFWVEPVSFAEGACIEGGGHAVVSSTLDAASIRRRGVDADVTRIDVSGRSGWSGEVTDNGQSVDFTYKGDCPPPSFVVGRAQLTLSDGTSALVFVHS